MIKKKIFLFIPLFLILASGILYSRMPGDVPKDNFLLSKYGFFGNVGLNIHQPDFEKLPDIPCCSPYYRSGSGFGYSIGGLFEFNVFSDYLLSMRVDYQNLSGTLTQREMTEILVDDKITEGEFDFILETELSVINFSPVIGYRIFDNFNVHGGFSAGYLINNHYDQVEKLQKPEDRGVFLDTKTRSRNEYQGQINDINTFFASVVAGVSYDLPLNASGSMLASAELMYYQGLTNMVGGLDWKVGSLRAGLSLKYAMLPPTEPRRIKRNVWVTDTIVVPSEYVSSNTFVLGKERISKDETREDDLIVENTRITRIDTLFEYRPHVLVPKDLEIRATGMRDGKETPQSEIIIEQFLYSSIQPLLNYIFFDHNSHELPDRYKKITEQEAKSFHMKDLFKKNKLETYYHVLNIIGHRMSIHPDAKIELTGCNSGVDEEKDNKELSEKRAESIKKYLVNSWDINEDRIKIKTRNLPSRPSNTDKEDGIEENRRVEITSDTPEIIDHVVTNDTLHISNPPIIRFYPKVNDKVKVSDWKIYVLHKESVVKEFIGKGDVPKFIDWELESDRDVLPLLIEDFTFMLEVTDNFKDTAQSQKDNLELKQISIRDKHLSKSRDKRFDHYSLILFDFNKKSLGSENKKIINYINKNLEDDSKAFVQGYSDRIGNEDYNYNLSLGRAKNVANSLRRGQVKYEGYGESVLLYDNSLPEGRFYCRTVEVVVETPIK